MYNVTTLKSLGSLLLLSKNEFQYIFRVQNSPFVNTKSKYIVSPFAISIVSTFTCSTLHHTQVISSFFLSMPFVDFYSDFSCNDCHQFSPKKFSQTSAIYYSTTALLYFPSTKPLPTTTLDNMAIHHKFLLYYGAIRKGSMQTDLEDFLQQHRGSIFPNIFRCDWIT